jgi:hypothetical protein
VRREVGRAAELFSKSRRDGRCRVRVFRCFTSAANALAFLNSIYCSAEALGHSKAAFFGGL